ncbi:MAG: hypothetical protein WDO70_07665 [Alphaproteobacteria bacterium]
MRLIVLCGGPSAERGISMNSARSLLDHLTPMGFSITPVYCDQQLRLYRLTPQQLYSNTPADFDFKLAQVGEPLDETQFVALCRQHDLVFPAIHGAFGEDGKLQALLEKHDIPFAGSPSATCHTMFNKSLANQHLARHGFATLPHCLVQQDDDEAASLRQIKEFFARHDLKRAVVKPTAGGSSLGVAMALSPEETLAKARLIFAKQHHHTAIIEPFCEGREFTVLILQNPAGKPVALIPSEIDLQGEESIFGYRHKYLPSCQVRYFCPPRLADDIILSIQKSAEVLFEFFGMRDFARLDGWWLDDDRVIFTDFNPISGMEQNSFLFQQASRLGFDHAEILYYVIASAARRHNLAMPALPQTAKAPHRKINVLFGGETAERQVSLMSGTNVWLKLRHSAKFSPEPFLLAPDGETVWRLPYSYTLHHTTEEIVMHCEEAAADAARLAVMTPPLRQRLGLPALAPDAQGSPKKFTLDEFCRASQKSQAFVFIALHGGAGEDGTVQKKLEIWNLPYNGSRPAASHLCMDKYETGTVIRSMHEDGLTAAAKMRFAHAAIAELLQNPGEHWHSVETTLGTGDVAIKPQADGCSAGVARLRGAAEFSAYLKAIESGQLILPPGALNGQSEPIELPSHPQNLLIEPYIETDPIRIENNALHHQPRSGWVELTVGVLESEGAYHALTPSITIAEGQILSLEEKFQGGTGINLTPPPESIMSAAQVELIREKIELTAEALGIGGYARIDIFFNTRTGMVMVIEANSLPGLTASTVIYHQALAEKPPLEPRLFLEKIIELGLAAHQQRQKTEMTCPA